MSELPSVTAEQERSSYTPSLLGNGKIHPRHLERLAIVYVRQSSPQQVLEHRESTALQYQLVELASHLGWSNERVIVIDEDQGSSARFPDSRTGFQHLLVEVGLNHVGLILGIEMSRLARSGKDWHQLLELCGIFGTLLADHDGVYNPGDYNDRLLLGLKGTMSEAELHILKNRMEHGRLNKARRGELFSHVPMGYIRRPSGEVAFEPDEQVQGVIRLIFDQFSQLRSAMKVLRYLIAHDVRLPIRPHKGSQRGQLQWRVPNSSVLLNMLHNPIYAGAYSYGRHQTDPQKKVPGKPYSGRTRPEHDQWHVLLQDRSPAYISWDQYLENQQILKQNAARFSTLGAARDGSTLLGGLITCGRCQSRMIVSYRGKNQIGHYGCQRPWLEGKDVKCQQLTATAIDELVETQILHALQPSSLELSINAEVSIQQQRDQLHQQWRLRLERTRFEVERAKRQYNAVEPENRLVARELEREWNDSLKEEQQLKEDYGRFCQQEPQQLGDEDRALIRSLAKNLPELWHSPSTKPSDRQTIVRQLLDAVEVNIQGDSEIVDVTLHWHGGFVSQHEVIRSVGRYEQLQDYQRLKNRVVQLRTEGVNATDIARHLNEEGFRTPRKGGAYTSAVVRKLVSQLGFIGPRAKKYVEHESLGEDEWWLSDLAKELSIPVPSLTKYCHRGWVHARRSQHARAWWIIWADPDELERLRRLRNARRNHTHSTYPPELTTPKRRYDE